MVNKIATILDLDERGFSGSLKRIGTSIGEADGIFGKFKAGGKAAFEQLGQYAGEFALTAGAAFTAFGVKAVGTFVDTAKAAVDLSAATGLSTEEASRWLAVGDDMKVSAESLTTSLGRVAKTLDSGKWEKYGIATRDAGGNALSTNEILLNAFDVLAKTTNETERATIGNDLFSKGYKDLAPMIGKTKAEMAAYLGQVEHGQVITESEAATAEKMRLAQDALSDSIKEFTLELGKNLASLAPVISSLASFLGTVSKINEEIPILDGSIQSLTKLWGFATDDSDKLTAAMTKLKGQMADTSDQVAHSHQEMSDAMRESTKAAKENEDQNAALSTAYQVLDTGLRNAKKSQDDMAQAVRDATRATQDSLGIIGDYEQSVRNADDAYAGLQAKILDYTVKNNAGLLSTTEHDKALRDIASSEHNLMGDILATADALAVQQGATDGSKQKTDILRAALEEARDKYPELSAEIDKYIAKLNSIPTSKKTTIEQVYTSGGNGGPVVQRRAAGGVTQPGVYRMGEHGPEDVEITGGMANVKRNDQIGQGTGGGNVTVVVYGAERTYVQDLATAIDKLRREGR
jgi:hypothetical protein